MHLGLSATQLPPSFGESHEQARAALRRIVRDLRSDLADMDRLLDKAERLIPVRIDTLAAVRTKQEHLLNEAPQGRVMSEAGCEPSRAEARPLTRVEEIASAYLIQANGNSSLERCGLARNQKI